MSTNSDITIRKYQLSVGISRQRFPQCCSVASLLPAASDTTTGATSTGLLDTIRTALSGSCRCVSCLRSSSNAVAGQASTAASRRRLYIGNSVTLLYSAIFATAIIFDADVKTKRRTELEKKIKAVKEEVEELRIEEARILNGLADRRKLRQLPLPLQRRQYSTVAATATKGFASVGKYWDANTLPIERLENREPCAFKDRPEMITDFFEKGSAKKRDPTDEDERVRRQYDLAGQDVLRERAIQLLAIRQLAIKLLLRPSIAHSYGEVVADYGEEFDHPKFKTQDFLVELHRIKRRITRLRFRKDESYDDLVKNITIQEQSALQQERQELHNNLQAAFESYNRKALSLQRLLLITSENLLASEEPVLPQTVELMITQFTRSKQNDLVKMVIDSLFPNRIRMTPPVIVSAINFFNKTKDLFGFDGFLRLLQGDSFPVNIPVLWETVRVGDVQVALPPKPRHPFVMNALISASLSFNQPQNADAYLHILRESGYNEGAQVLGSYLRFYTVSPNWRKGGYVLLRSVAFIMSTKAHFGNAINRLILYMVAFCNSCGKHDLSEAIVKAAVDTGIDWRPSYNKRDLRSSVKTALKQWNTAAERASTDIPVNRPLGQKCYEFAKQIEQMVRVTIGYSANAPSHNPPQSRERVDRSFDVRLAGQIYESQDREPTTGGSYYLHDESRSSKSKQAVELTRRKAEHAQFQKNQPDEEEAERNIVSFFVRKPEEGCVKDSSSAEEIRRRRFHDDCRSLFYSLGVSKRAILDLYRELNEYELRIHASEVPAEKVKEELSPEACGSLFYSLAISQKTIGDLQREVDEYGLHIHTSEVPIEGRAELLET
ncbi:conserved hypothetical protein [Histoplasma capsulatum var. duboisii H88]|uniref:Uncharacterized protein n=1 Tax=Ajellomyces capsulatus (strain H88) TaxID=544711 RepID=F0UMT3_AJEC8|nr:conserved hypothetical protein [Histoplasma capsulatum var. duboisii H88]